MIRLNLVSTFQDTCQYNDVFYQKSMARINCTKDKKLITNVFYIINIEDYKIKMNLQISKTD